jgi:hypothetical protein
MINVCFTLRDSLPGSASIGIADQFSSSTSCCKTVHYALIDKYHQDTIPLDLSENGTTRKAATTAIFYRLKE